MSSGNSQHFFLPIGSFFPSHSGGPSLSAFSLASGLAGHGGRVVVSTTVEGINLEGLRTTVQRKNIHTLIQRTRGAYNRGRIVTLINHYRSRKWTNFDVYLQILYFSQKSHYILILTGFFNPFSIFAYLVCAYRRRKIFWFPRGELMPAALIKSPWRKKLWLRVFRGLQILLPNKNVTWVATSEVEKMLICKETLRSDYVYVLPNFFDSRVVAETDLVREKENFRARTGEITAITFGYIGRISPKKNIEQLFMAFSSFSKSISAQIKPALIIAGYSDPVDYVPNTTLLKESIVHTTFVGRLEGPEKWKFFSKIDILVLPSFGENFGNVVPEALSAGVLVLFSNKTPFGEMGIPNEVGTSFDSVSSCDLASKMTQMAGEFINNKHGAIKARKTFEQYFELKGNMNELLFFFSDK